LILKEIVKLTLVHKVLLNTESIAIKLLAGSIIEAGEWLTDEIIQAYLFAISKPKKNHIIQSKVIADIITGKEVNIYKKNFSFCKFETLAGVYNKGNCHWCLFLVSIKQKFVAFIDPYTRPADDEMAYYYNWE
jgi:hypothetical protein